MRVLVCGSRKFDDLDLLITVLEDIIHENFDVFEKEGEGITFITGDANGADWLARSYAKMWSKWFPKHFSYIGFPADWTKYKNRAGPIRNAQMLKDGKPDLVVAFPGDSGTADMVTKAKKAGVEVFIVGDNNGKDH